MRICAILGPTLFPKITMKMLRFRISITLTLGVALIAAGAAAKPLNVLLITIDDLRPELGAYGVNAAYTPNIDRLAEKGIKFENAFCQYPVCNPSRSSFLTGLRPDELGIVSNQIPLRQKWPDIVTLPQLFRNNGYFTAGIGKLFHAGLDDQGNRTLFQDDASFDHFFRAYNQSRQYRDQAFLEGRGRLLGDQTVGWAHWIADEGGDEAQPDGQNAQEAVRIMEENASKPFFIGVGFHKPHDPFIAPKEYFERYPLDEIELAKIPEDQTPPLEYSTPGNYNFQTYTDRDRREFKRAYLACTTFVDAQVGKLLATMDRLELWDNTIVVLMGDHGYHLGEHSWWNKVTVFDIGARAPFMIWVPGSIHMGRSTDSVVEFVDLYPTLADLCKLDAPHELSGQSLRSIIENRATIDKPAYTQVTRSKIGMGYSVRFGDWRFTQWGKEGEGGYELYNTVEDRIGYYNLADNPEYASIREQLSAMLRIGYPVLQKNG